MKEKGQSLVEMAIIAPILIFMLIGVFEVGWALRGYIVLTNANREAARFAVRQNYLQFHTPDIGYEKVWTHTLESIGGQIPFDSRGTMIISYISVMATCTGTYTVTTPINVPTYTWKYPLTATEESRINYTEVASRMLTEQKEHVCNQEYFNIVPGPSNALIVEMWMTQPQLFGFPVISNPYTNPVPMYAHSVFRKIQESRNNQ